MTAPFDHSVFRAKAKNLSILAALSVVIIHAGAGGMGSFTAKIVHQFLAWGLCTFAVPWFFFASGYFLAGHVGEDKWWPRALKSRMRTLALPFILWCTLYVVFAAVLDAFNALQSGAAPFASFTLENCLWQGFGLDLLNHPRLVPFWYIRALFFLICLSPLLVWMLRRWQLRTILAMVPAYVYCCAVHSRYDGPWFIFYGTFSLAGLVYFSSGMLLRLGLAENARGKLARIPSAVACLMALALIVGGRLALYRGLLQLSDTCWLLGIPPLLMAAYRLVPPSPWPVWLTGAAFPIYALHYFLEHFLENTILPIGHPSFLAYLLRIIAVAAGSLTIAALMRRYMPRESRILFGGRGT